MIIEYLVIQANMTYTKNSYMNSVLTKNRISIFFLAIWFFSFLHFIHLAVEYYQADCHHHTASAEHSSCENFLELQVFLEKSKVLIPFLLTVFFFSFKKIIKVVQTSFHHREYIPLLTRLFSRGILHSKIH